MAGGIQGYRKVGRVLFVTLMKANVTRWNDETKLAAYQVGLTAMRKTVVMPDLPHNRDSLLKLLPWVHIEAVTTDKCREMLKVPEGVKWQDLRDNMPEPELPYPVMTVKIARERSSFFREMMWLKQEMRERLGVRYVKPFDNIDPSERSFTATIWDDAAKEYWKDYIKDKMRSNRRFARFQPTPKHGFNNASVREMQSLFMHKSGRGNQEMTMHERAVPYAGTPQNNFWRRYGTLKPIAKVNSPMGDRLIPNMRSSFKRN